MPEDSRGGAPRCEPESADHTSKAGFEVGHAIEIVVGYHQQKRPKAELNSKSQQRTIGSCQTDEALAVLARHCVSRLRKDGGPFSAGVGGNYFAWVLSQSKEHRHLRLEGRQTVIHIDPGRSCSSGPCSSSAPALQRRTMPIPGCAERTMSSSIFNHSGPRWVFPRCRNYFGYHVTVTLWYLAH